MRLSVLVCLVMGAVAGSASVANAQPSQSSATGNPSAVAPSASPSGGGNVSANAQSTPPTSALKDEADALTAIATTVAAIVAAVSAFLAYRAAREAHAAVALQAKSISLQDRYGKAQIITGLWTEYSAENMHRALTILNSMGQIGKEPQENTEEKRQERMYTASRSVYQFYRRVHLYWKDKLMDDIDLEEFLKTSGYTLFKYPALKAVELSYEDSTEGLFHDLDVTPVPRVAWADELQEFANKIKKRASGVDPTPRPEAA